MNPHPTSSHKKNKREQWYARHPGQTRKGWAKEKRAERLKKLKSKRKEKK